MPLNVMDAHFRSFEQQVLPVLVREQIGVLGMKSMGSGLILQSKTVSAAECLHYAMNLPTSVVITGIDSMERLDQAVEAAQTFKPLTPEEVGALLGQDRPGGRHGAVRAVQDHALLRWDGEESPVAGVDCCSLVRISSICASGRSAAQRAGTPGGFLGPAVRIGAGRVIGDQRVALAVGGRIPTILVGDVLDRRAEGILQLDAFAGIAQRAGVLAGNP